MWAKDGENVGIERLDHKIIGTSPHIFIYMHVYQGTHHKIGHAHLGIHTQAYGVRIGVMMDVIAA